MTTEDSRNSEIEDIFLGYDLDYVTAENKFKRGHIDKREWNIRRKEALAKATHTIKNLLTQEVNKAVVAELENLSHNKAETHETPIYGITNRQIQDRIKALTVDKEQAE